MTATYVVARDYDEYKAWCERKRVQPTHGEYIYVSGPHRLRGLERAQILFVGGWAQRPDWRKIYELACLVGRPPS